jgi:DNA-binding LytR/AlgR family response regulator
VSRIRPPRFGWPVTVALHLALTVPVSLGHVGIMTVLRHLVYAAQGLVYQLRTAVPDDLLYEYRKDVPDYLLIAATLVILERLLRPSPAESFTPATPAKIEVRDGSRTTWLAPADVLWAEAAGNYVELHTTTGNLLHRTSLTALERELAPHGFARIHRSRLVRREAVRAVETNASGDFDATLANGARVSGSRRYRSALER